MRLRFLLPLFALVLLSVSAHADALYLTGTVTYINNSSVPYQNVQVGDTWSFTVNWRPDVSDTYSFDANFPHGNDCISFTGPCTYNRQFTSALQLPWDLVFLSIDNGQIHYSIDSGSSTISGDLDGGTFSYYGNGGSQANFGGTVTALHAIPEPASIYLLLTGLVAYRRLSLKIGLLSA